MCKIFVICAGTNDNEIVSSTKESEEKYKMVNVKTEIKLKRPSVFDVPKATPGPWLDARIIKTKLEA